MKHIRYLRYIIRHKAFVLYAGMIIGAPLWRLLIHDWSKFLPSEWLPYVEKFYGSSPTSVEVKFHFWQAWLLHQHRNRHHWQHWILREDSGETIRLEIPDHFVREMVADWAGAGRGITGKWEFAKWFQENKHKMALNGATQIRVETYIMLLQKRLDTMPKA